MSPGKLSSFEITHMFLVPGVDVLIIDFLAFVLIQH
jgi:hypothetical protein